MTLSDLGEVIKTLGAVATAGAAWFAAMTAYKGLEKWRTEAIGKQKVERATEMLQAVYEFAEILRSAREPWVLPHETGKQEGVPDAIAQNSNYVPEKRLLAHQEFFSRFRSLKFQYAAIFGKDATKPLDELWRCRLDINHAVHSMLMHSDMGKSRDPEDIALWKEWYYTAFRDAKESSDEMLKRINTQVAIVEATCRAAIGSTT